MIRVRGVLVALVLGTAAAAQPPRTLTRRDRPEVTSVKIVGINHLDAGALADGLVTHASHCKNLLLDPFCLVWKTPLFYEHDYLDRTELKRDVLRALIFLYRHGYHDAIVDTVLTPPAGLTVAVTFKVQRHHVYDVAPATDSARTFHQIRHVVHGLACDGGDDQEHAVRFVVRFVDGPDSRVATVSDVASDDPSGR